MTPRQRAITIALGVLFGGISVLPHVWLRVDAGSSFAGVEIQATDAETHYASRVRETYDGEPLAANVYFAGTKHQPYFFPPLPEFTIAVIGKAFGLDAARAVLLSRFLFGAALWFVMAGFLTAMSRRWAASLLATAAVMLAGPVFSGPWIVTQLLQGTAGAIEFLPFSRPINPEWSLTLFFAALWAFTVWNKTSSRRALACAGAFTIAAVYSYIYVWTVLGVVYAAFGIRALIRRDWKQTRHLLFLGLVIAVGAMPYVWNMRQASLHPNYLETARRLGMVVSRAPVVSVTLIVLLALAAAVWKRLGEAGFLAMSLGLALAVALNQQIVSGQALAAPHYHWYFVKPLAIALLVLLAWMWLEDTAKERRGYARQAASVAWWCAIGFSLIFGVMYQRASYLASRSLWLDLQRTGPALAYLDSHLAASKVVYARDVIRELVPVYSSANVYWATNAGNYLSSDRRSLDAYFFDLWVDGVTADQAAAEFPDKRRAELSSRIHAIYYREAAGDISAMPDAEVEAAAKAYREYLALSDDERLRAYQLDFAVLKKDLPETPAVIALKTRSSLLYQDEAYEIYRMK